MEKKKVVLIDLILVFSVLAAGIAAKILLSYISLPGCPFLTATGLPCPACGGTRCVMSIVQGKITAAFNFNPYFFLIFTYLFVLFIVFNIRHLTQNRIAQKLLRIMCDYRVIIGWALLCPVFWVLRVASLL